MTQRSTTIFVTVLVTMGFLFAGGYLLYRSHSESIDGYYTVDNVFTDTTITLSAKVGFVSVVAYDSVKMLKTAEKLTREFIESGAVDNNKQRDFLFHFFMRADTAPLTELMIDEIAYAHPEIVNPAENLLSVPGGWVVRARFAPRSIQPQSIEIRHTSFYKPRSGVRQADLKQEHDTR